MLLQMAFLLLQEFSLMASFLLLLIVKVFTNIFYETLIIFLESAIKLITGIVLIMAAQVLFFNVFYEKDPHLNAVEWWFLNIHWFRL